MSWTDELLRNPHAAADKRLRVQKMFAAIAPSYDINNRLHSLWMDQRWRKKAVKLAELKPNDRVVDVACGTGDLTLAFIKQLLQFGIGPNRQAPLQKVLGLDFTFEMLPIARKKGDVPFFPWGMIFDPPLRYSSFVGFLNGDAQTLPFSHESADVVTIAFGIRNVADPAAALREFHRVLRPGGRLIVLEFSLPTNRILRTLYNFYFRKILPHTATWISRDKTGAYKYLPESVNTFIGREQMMSMMRDAGFDRIEQFPLTFGICVCYRGVRS